MTKNYGIKGGTLDATKHIELALTRLCFPEEQAAYKEKLALLAIPGKKKADQN